MGHPHWNIFEWDHADLKNGNVQYLRDHNIEPHEAEECFSHEFIYSRLCLKSQRAHLDAVSTVTR